MNAGPRLSIGLPVYNGENYLAESLDALLGQTYEDFELIISDNASTDGTADICHSYAKQDSRIRYIRQRQNIGCAPNHNYLVDEARGELFKWASDDDLYARDMIRLCVEALDEKLFLAARNLPFVEVIEVARLNPLSLASYDKVLATVGAVKMIEERLQ